MLYKYPLYIIAIHCKHCLIVIPHPVMHTCTNISPRGINTIPRITLMIDQSVVGVCLYVNIKSRLPKTVIIITVYIIYHKCCFCILLKFIELAICFFFMVFLHVLICPRDVTKLILVITRSPYNLPLNR